MVTYCNITTGIVQWLGLSAKRLIESKKPDDKIKKPKTKKNPQITGSFREYVYIYTYYYYYYYYSNLFVIFGCKFSVEKFVVK